MRVLLKEYMVLIAQLEHQFLQDTLTLQKVRLVEVEMR